MLVPRINHSGFTGLKRMSREFVGSLGFGIDSSFIIPHRWVAPATGLCRAATRRSERGRLPDFFGGLFSWRASSPFRPVAGRPRPDSFRGCASQSHFGVRIKLSLNSLRSHRYGNVEKIHHENFQPQPYRCLAPLPFGPSARQTCLNHKAQLLHQPTPDL